MDAKQIEKFYNFLTLNNCYVKFFAYFKFLNKKYDDVNVYLELVDIQEIFALAFPWDDTDEGLHYWDKLHNKWRESIKKRVLYFVAKREIPDNIDDKQVVSLMHKITEDTDIKLVDCKVIYE